MFLVSAVLSFGITMALKNQGKLKAEEKKTNNHVYKIVLTGGPCGGKSTALNKVKKTLEENGISVYTVPEVATIIFTNGVKWGNIDESEKYVILEEIIRLQISLENSFVNMAKASGKPSVVIMDRGLQDNEAYVPYEEMWNLIMDNNSWDTPGMRDKRYDKVLHLVTAAIGAEQFYTKANNAARRETPEQAAELDKKIRRGWVGHQNVVIIDNSTDFKTKMERVSNAIFELVGLDHHISSPVEKRLFLLKDKQIDLKKIDSRVSKIHTDIIFLNPEIHGKDACIYRRGQDNSFEYYLSEPSANVEKLIKVEEYIKLKVDADKTRETLHKDLQYFYHNNHYYCLSTVNGKNILEVYLEKGRPLNLPHGHFKEIPQEKIHSYSDYSLAAKN